MNGEKGFALFQILVSNFCLFKNGKDDDILCVIVNQFANHQTVPIYNSLLGLYKKVISNKYGVISAGKPVATHKSVTSPIVLEESFGIFDSRGLFLQKDLILFLIHIIKKKTFIYSKGAISERGVDNLVVSHTNVCNKVTK